MVGCCHTGRRGLVSRAKQMESLMANLSLHDLAIGARIFSSRPPRHREGLRHLRSAARLSQRPFRQGGECQATQGHDVMCGRRRKGRKRFEIPSTDKSLAELGLDNLPRSDEAFYKRSGTGAGGFCHRTGYHVLFPASVAVLREGSPWDPWIENRDSFYL